MNMDFFLSGSIYIEASLKPSLCSAQHLGATGIILLSKNYFQILCFEQIRKINYMTRCRQQLWPGAINIYKPVILVILNRQVLHLQTGWISDEYFKTNIFSSQSIEGRFKWILYLQYFFRKQIDYEAGLLTRIF